MLKKILFSSLVLTVALNANNIPTDETDCENTFEKCVEKCEKTKKSTKDPMCIEKCEFEFDKCLITQESNIQNETYQEYQEDNQNQN